MWIWLFVFPALEFFAAVEFLKEFGAFSFLFLLGVSFFVGVSFIRLAGAPGNDPIEAATKSMVYLLAGLLFIFPGIVSDGIAVFLLIPGVRQFLFRSLLGPLKGRVSWVKYSDFEANTGPIRDVTPEQPQVIDVTPKQD